MIPGLSIIVTVSSSKAAYIVGNRVVHSSHFWAIFSPFLFSFLISFFKNGLQNEMKMSRKMIIFEKWTPSLAFPKMIIFPFIFQSHFCSSFKLRSDAYLAGSLSLSRYHLFPLPPNSITTCHRHFRHHFHSCEWPQTAPS
jgi:hypothetical protein